MSRVGVFFRLLLAVPQLIVVYVLFLPLGLLTVMAWFAILFTGRYPRAFFEFTSGVLRWGANVTAYCALLRDEYPPFSWDVGAYPLTLDIPLAPRQSRFRLFIRAFAILPNMLVFWFVQQAWLFTTFFAWCAILITGRYPRGLFRFSVGVIRWWQRQAAYVYLLRDEYPPYSINADARPGNEAVSLIAGVPLFFLFVVGQLLPFVALLGNESKTVVVRSELTSSAALRSEQPSGEANGVRITLMDYEDRAFPSSGRGFVRSGFHYVAFDVAAEKDGRWPAFFTPFFLRLHDCRSGVYSPVAIDEIDGTFAFGLWWFDGDSEGYAYFEVPPSFEPCELVYHAGLGEVRFEFP